MDAYAPKIYGSEPPPKRLHTSWQPYQAFPTRGMEQDRMLAQDCREPLTAIPFGPTFHPTVEEFSGDPLLYIEKIRPEAEKWGICKIVPPKGWNPPFALNIECPTKFQTKDQSIHRLQEGISFGDGKDYTVKDYQKYSVEWSKKWKERHYSVPDKPNQEESKPPILGSRENISENQAAPPAAPLSSQTAPPVVPFSAQSAPPVAPFSFQPAEQISEATNEVKLREENKAPPVLALSSSGVPKEVKLGEGNQAPTVVAPLPPSEAPKEAAVAPLSSSEAHKEEAVAPVSSNGVPNEVNLGGESQALAVVVPMSSSEAPKEATKLETTGEEHQTPTAPLSSSEVTKVEKQAEENIPRPKMTPENLERDYWDIVEMECRAIDVDYGNDVDTSEFGSGFPISERGRSVNSPGFLKNGQSNENLPEPAFGTEEFYKETYWNLNNIPNSKRSVLRHLKVGINGINVPWLYFGCLFSTFCWHNEDNYMYSINYAHKGAPKQWYGVPGTKKDADGVERVFKNYLSMKMRDVPDLLHHITTSFSPRLLKKEGVPVCKLLQHAGEFIVTFPRAFHGGFSMGPNCGEAVNFALQDWIPHAVDANERYRTFARPSVFSHDRLVYTMAFHDNELRTKEICQSLSQELRRLMQEELLLRQKLLHAGVRDLSNSNDIDLPPNRLDQLDEQSADYDDKRLCHSCKHICFFSAVICECSSDKVSCLRHSHYMCRCSIKRKYILIWTRETEMKEAILRVEKRGRELNDSKPPVPVNPSFPGHLLGNAPGSSKDAEEHQTYEVPVDPICPIDSVRATVSSLVSSDTSICSFRSQGDSSISLKDPPEKKYIISGALSNTTSIAAPSNVQQPI